MTTHVPMSTPRQPFALLDSPRLQHLTSIKNRQNGIISSPLASAKNSMSNINKSTIFNVSSTKRKVETSIYEDVDSENADPSVFLSPSKRSKCNDSTPLKPAYSLSTTPSSIFSKTSPSSMPPPSIPSSLTPRNTANTSSPRAPLTAPAGRSPKSKRSILSQKARRVSAPYTRIDPPSFHSNSTTSALPFSLDAALQGTLSRSNTKSASKTIEESMPRDWFFEIYEDTPEDEASNMMEHGAHCLDISDDESSKRAASDRGKENTPPAGYESDAPSSEGAVPVTQTISSGITTGSTSRHTKSKKVQQTRRKIIEKDDMDDGERTPLSKLEPEQFYPQGLTKDSQVFIGLSPGKTTECTIGKDIFVADKKLFHQPNEVLDVPVVNAKSDFAGDIFIFEDAAGNSENEIPSTPVSVGKVAAGEKRKRTNRADDDDA